ncbi:Prostaglandin E2 receptor EP3 subtype, partial [Armadillidium vulgare]
SFIALCYLHRSTRRSHNRTVFYVLLSTLIWTDFIGKLITTPPAILSYSFRRWVGGTKLCRFHGFCMGLIDLATHFLVSAMAIDRFICVRFCYFYKSNFTQCRARTALIGVWAFCLTFSSLPLFGIGEFEIQYPCTWCFINIHVKKSTLWYHQVYTNVFGLLNIMNIIIIFVCNVMVIGILLSVRMSRTRKFSASSRQLPVNTTQRELELQMSIVLFVITLVFLISWSPLDIRLFLNQIWPHTCQEDHVVDLIAVRLASFNQIIDPWAYIICRRGKA